MAQTAQQSSAVYSAAARPFRRRHASLPMPLGELRRHDSASVGGKIYTDRCRKEAEQAPNPQIALRHRVMNI